MAGKKVDAPGLSDALVGVKLVSDTIVDMLVEDEQWAGSPQKGHRRKLQKIADHLHVLADAGARAAKIPQGVDVRYKEARSHVQRGLDFSHVTSDVASASKTACEAKYVTSSVCAGVGLHVRRTERRLMCSTAVCALVCARQTAKSSTSSTLFMDTNRRASPKFDRHNLHFGAAHHDTDHGTSTPAIGAFILGRAGKLSSIWSTFALF